MSFKLLLKGLKTTIDRGMIISAVQSHLEEGRKVKVYLGSECPDEGDIEQGSAIVQVQGNKDMNTLLALEFFFIGHVKIKMQEIVQFKCKTRTKKKGEQSTNQIKFTADENGSMINEEDLMNSLKSIGEIESFQFIKNFKTGQRTNSGIISFKESSSAQIAISKESLIVNGVMILITSPFVRVPKEKPARRAPKLLNRCSTRFDPYQAKNSRNPSKGFISPFGYADTSEGESMSMDAMSFDAASMDMEEIVIKEIPMSFPRKESPKQKYVKFKNTDLSHLKAEYFFEDCSPVSEA